jgi:hypothetical protein
LGDLQLTNIMEIVHEFNCKEQLSQTLSQSTLGKHCALCIGMDNLFAFDNFHTMCFVLWDIQMIAFCNIGGLCFCSPKNCLHFVTFIDCALCFLTLKLLHFVTSVNCALEHYKLLHFITRGTLCIVFWNIEIVAFFCIYRLCFVLWSVQTGCIL